MKRIYYILLLAMFTLNVSAWKGMEMKKLHIDGRWLCDDGGNHVNLHGYGQTYSPWFNEQGNGWGWGKNVSACLNYNQGLIRKIDEAGWKANWLRLHMDPHWSNDDALVNAWKAAHPGEDYGENHIEGFSETLFRKYLDEVFVPMAEYAISYGLYVVMRPPGVCPQKIGVGDAYHNYLRNVWTIVASHAKLKNNPYVMFELANEPILMNDGSGNYTNNSDGSQKKCTEFFQQIVNDIRGVGCNNILWVPGLSYQMLYQGYEKYPVVEPGKTSGSAVADAGRGIGYAVHCYPGWYGSDSEAEGGSVEQGVVTKGAGYVEFRDGWAQNVGGIAAKSPVLVTEMDWAPKSYNCSWGKATTGQLGGVGFGANFRFIMDKTGNVSWMLFTGPEHLAKYDDSAADGKTFLTDPQACVRPCYRWFKEYQDPNFSSYSEEKEKHILDSIEAVKEEQRKQVWYYPNTTDRFDANIWEKGSVTENADGSFTLVTGQYGFGGFQFSGGRDFSAFKYMVVKFATRPSSGGWSFRLFDHSSYWTEPAMYDCVNKDMVVVNLQSMKNNKSEAVDPSHIYIMGFWSYGGSKLNIKEMYVTNNDDYTLGIGGVVIDSANADGRLFNLSGQQITTPRPGTIVIRNGRKFVVK